MKKYVVELIGTMVLVLLGCGSAVFAGGVAMAFGLSVIAMASFPAATSIRPLHWVYGCREA